MKKKIFSKILSTILVLSLILSVFVPMGSIIGAAAEAKSSTYTSAFNNIDAIKADGWKGFFSKDPQGGVAFSEIADSDYGTYYDTWGGNVIARAKKSGLYNSSTNWDNANNFTNMAALTYTAQTYKYFKLTVDYKFENENVPWPVITFNQQNTTPEIFYKTNKAIASPSYNEEPIGVYYENSGNVMISGKKVTYHKATASDTTSKRNGWRKAEITVTPGKVNLKVYDSDLEGANVVVDYTTDITDDYKGGYITLMQNGVSLFKNISIVGLPAVTINDYYTTPDGNGGIADDTILVERTYGKLATYSDILPQRSGYSFMGFYGDDKYTNEIALGAMIKDEQYLYVKWSDFADITADGNVNLKDLVRIKKMAASIVDANAAADLDFDGTNANGSDITVLRKKLTGEDVSSSVSSASELMNAGILYPLGRTMVLDGAVEMDHVNTGFVLKGNFEGDVKADFTTNRTGSLLNVSIDGGENKVVDLNLDGLTTLAEDLDKGEHTIEVISGTSTKYSTTPDTERGTQAFDGTLKLNKLYYNGIPTTYVSDKTSKILFIGDQITCGMGLDVSVQDGGYKASNAYYSYASVLGRMLNAEVEVNARCGAKVCHFVWADCGASNNEGRGKGLCNGIDWLKSINVRNSTQYDYANNQPDIVVINLGSNDIPYAKDENGKWVDIWDDTGNKYSEEVPPLLNRVHTFYPNAKIVWTVGMMDRKTDISKEYIGYFKDYVENWSAANNNMAYFLDLSYVADRGGHNEHPTTEGHRLAAAELYDFILANDIGINVSTLAELDSVQKKNNSVVLSVETIENTTETIEITFPKTGGVRLNGTNKGLHESSENYNITCQTAGDVTTVTSDNGAYIELIEKTDDWSLAIYNSSNEKVNTINGSQICFFYDKENNLSKTSISGSVSDGETFTGLGERFNGLVQNGDVITLWNEDCLNSNFSDDSNKTASYINIPMLNSTNGYSIFLNTTYKTVADIASSDKNAYTLVANGNIFDIYCF